MTDYTKNTNFTAKDSLSSGDPSKIIKGSEFDAEFNEIATAISSKEDTANKGAANGYCPLDAGGLVAVSDLPATVPLLDAATNTFTGSLIAAVGAFSTTLELGGAGVWTSGNDGSGSGLDADLLRGTTPSAFGLTLIDDADAATARSTLGLGTAATFASTAFETADAAIVKSDENEIITAAWRFAKVYTAPVADSSSSGVLTISTNDSNVFTTTVTENITTLTLGSAVEGQTINVLFTIGGIGNYTITWPASFKWPGGTEGALSTGVGAIDLLVATYIGTTWYASLLNDFQ